jgi:hypothetical protein
MRETTRKCEGAVLSKLYPIAAFGFRLEASKE